mgnify:CR=1 FL=1
MNECSQKFDFAKPVFKHIPTEREIIVPVSGGKDSTATLILALQNFDKDKTNYFKYLNFSFHFHLYSSCENLSACSS